MRPTIALALCLATIGLAQGAEFSPGGEAGQRRLLGHGNPAAADVRAAVDTHGFYAGRPIGAGGCARCHPDVAEAWAASAHRHSSFSNPYYTAAARAFLAVRGPGGFTFCANCHDPALAIRGPIFDLDVGAVAAQAGIGCLVCHSMKDTPPPTGNGLFHVALDPVPIGDGHGARVAIDGADGARCGTCHRVGIEAELSDGRWRRGQDDLFGWRDSPYASGGADIILERPEPATCIDCHMPRVAASSREKGARDGRVRDHRWLGAGTALAHLRGDDAHREATERFLADAITVELAQVRPGELDIVMTNRRVGHPFPAGVNDTNQAWVQVTVLDDGGQVIARSGHLDAEGRLPPSSHLIRAQAVNDMGDPLPKRETHRQRETVFDTRLMPLRPRIARYRLPDGARRVEVALSYRQFPVDYAAFACATLPETPARARCLAPPSAVIAKATATVEDGALSARPDPSLDLRHGLALAEGLAIDARDADRVLARAEARSPDDPRPILGRACAAIALGRTDAALALLDRADALPGAPPARHLLRARALGSAYRTGPARKAADALLAALPGDRMALALAARLRSVDGDPNAALTAADRLLALDPQSPAGWYQRMLATRALALETEARDAGILWNRRRVVDEDVLRLRTIFRQRHPARAPHLDPIPTRTLVPIAP